MTKPEVCAICHGTGVVKDSSGKEVPCRNCASQGMVVEEKGPSPATPPKEE